MTIEISKTEYRTLLEMLYISDWVLNTFTNGLEEENKNHKALKEKLLSFHEKIQAEDVLREFQSNEFDDYMHVNHIEKYNQNMFWETLIDQLAYRDLAKEIGIEAFDQLDPVVKIERLEEFRENYAKEFEQHQLERIKIDFSNAI
jgi:hypothetical protein